MKKVKMLKYMNLLDDKFILEASPERANEIRKSHRFNTLFLRYGAVAASLVFVVGISLLIPHLRIETPATSPQTDEMTGDLFVPGEVNSTETLKEQDHVTPPETDEGVDIEQLQDKIDGIQNAVGGGSTFFVRKYVDETYNLAYLRSVYRDETGVVSEDELNEWVDNVYLKQETEDQNESPTIYQAINYLGVAKEDLVSLNESRKIRGSEMVLSDEIIDALYLPEDEMKEALVHPCALYYNGEIYTWEEVRSTEFESGEGIPWYIVEQYVDDLIVYCVENEIISESHISRYFDFEE